MKWTEEQLKAINEEGKNIIISAGAGSGKTAVLTERVLRKLNEGVNINESPYKKIQKYIRLLRRSI